MSCPNAARMTRGEVQQRVDDVEIHLLTALAQRRPVDADRLVEWVRGALESMPHGASTLDRILADVAAALRDDDPVAGARRLVALMAEYSASVDLCSAFWRPPGSVTLTVVEAPDEWSGRQRVGSDVDPDLDDRELAILATREGPRFNPARGRAASPLGNPVSPEVDREERLPRSAERCGAEPVASAAETVQELTHNQLDPVRLGDRPPQGAPLAQRQSGGP